MTYSPNIPQATDNPSQSQSQILANFQQINTQYGTGPGLVGDHVALTSSINNGKHNKVSWIDQTASPPTSGLNQVVAYGITNAGITMPYYQRDTIATVFPLAPIKAYASFQTLLAPGAIVAADSFNIATIQQVSNLVITVTLTNSCRTTTYGVLAFGGVNNPRPNDTFCTGYSITANNIFDININTNAFRQFLLTVIVLET